MAQWLVTQGDNQFSVDGLDELEDLARQGRLSAGDMLQPPGTSEWLYVSEVDELRAILGTASADVDIDVDYRRSGSTTSMIAAVLVALIVVGGGVMLYFAQQLPDGSESLFGEGGLNYSQMIVTAEGSGLRSEPDERASLRQPVKKDGILELLSKRKEWYRARANGQEGWIHSSDVIPVYQLGGADVREELDPLYNPERYVDVVDARWMQLPAENPRPGRELSNVTVFEFTMENKAVYHMTDLVIQATIKDAKGHELDMVELRIEGRIPPEGHTSVGTLMAEEDDPEALDRWLTAESFEEMSEEEPDLQMLWKSGVEVEMNESDGAFTNAEIDIIELRAIPDDEAARVVRRDEP